MPAAALFGWAYTDGGPEIVPRPAAFASWRNARDLRARFVLGPVGAPHTLASSCWPCSKEETVYVPKSILGSGSPRVAVRVNRLVGVRWQHAHGILCLSGRHSGRLP